MGDEENLADQEPVEETPAVESAEGSQTAENQGEAEGRSQEEPKFITLEEHQRLMGEAEDRIVKRLKDSNRDQISNQLSQKLQAYNESVRMQERAGIKVPPEDQAKVRQVLLQESLAGEEQPTSQPGTLTDDDWARYVADQASRVFKRVGVDVVKGDPEFAVIAKSYSDPNNSLADLLVDIKEAAETKKARIAKTKSTAGARVTKGGGTSISPSDISQITDTAALYEMGERQLRGDKP